MGMSLNEEKKFTIQPEEAYGQKMDDYIHSFNRSEVPPEVNPEVGQTITLSTQDGQNIPALIVQADDEKVVVDMNHPLAGEALTFEIKVVGISETQTQESQGCGCGCDDQDGCEPSGCSGGC